MPLFSQVRAYKEASSTLEFVQRPQQQPWRRYLRPHTSTTCSHSRATAVTTRVVQQLYADQMQQSPRRKPCSVARSLRKTRLRRRRQNRWTTPQPGAKAVAAQEAARPLLQRTNP